MAGLATTLGSGAMTDSIANIVDADLLFVTGSNTTEAHPIIGLEMKRAVRKFGARLILLDPRENAYCVPLERAASLVAGVGGTILLAWFFGGAMPRSAELVGAAILIGAIVLLSVAPRFSRKN